MEPGACLLAAAPRQIMSGPALSVRPRPGQDRALIGSPGRETGSPCFLIAADWRAGRCGVKVERPAGRTTLTPRCPAPDHGAARKQAGVGGGVSGHRMKSFPSPVVMPRSPFPAVPGAQPYLGARSAVPGSGDMMRDGVPRRWEVAAARSLEAAQDVSWQQAGGGSRPQVHRFTGAPSAERGGSRGGGDRLLPELAQGVVAAAGELAGDRERGQAAGAPVPGGGVVAVVRCGGAGGALG